MLMLWCHLQLGHPQGKLCPESAHSYWQFWRYHHFVFPPILLFWTADTETGMVWDLRHGHRTDPTTAHLPICQAHSQCHCYHTNSSNLSLFLHFDAPLELAPSQLHCNWQWGPPLIHLCSPGNQIPGDACTVDTYWRWTGTKSNQGESFQQANWHCSEPLWPSGKLKSKFPTAPKSVDTICHDKCQGACTNHDGDGHTPSAPSRTAPIAHDSIQLTEQTAL